MVMNRKATGTASSMPGGLAAGTILSMTVTVLGALIAAHLISKEMIQQDNIGYCSMAILLLSSVIGAKVASGRIKRRHLMVCAMSGAIYYLVLLAMTALLFDGIYDGMGVTALIVFCGSMLVALTGMKGEGTANRKRNKIRHR